MKQIKLAVVAIFTLLTTSTLVAQDANNPWAVTVGINAVDVSSGGSFTNGLKDFFGTGADDILSLIHI